MNLSRWENNEAQQALMRKKTKDKLTGWPLSKQLGGSASGCPNCWLRRLRKSFSQTTHGTPLTLEVLRFITRGAKKRVVLLTKKSSS